jgi:murein DD-endopeptidase MepM/ murein hydrolase activator NlpD
LKVKTGEKVNEGQIVGSVESDSVMSGVFHFELRHFSEAKDPLEWLAKLN